MYNPSYLVKSRHDVFYFRYPLPITTYIIIYDKANKVKSVEVVK